MDRSDYPGRVEARSAHLQNTEATKIFHILRRFLDTSQMGVATGLVVTAELTGNAGLFSMTAGTGYAPNGSYIELSAGASLQAINTPSSDTSTTDFIGVMYREVQQGGGARLDDGSTQSIRTVRDAQVKVFTPTEWMALPESDPNLALDAKDRFLLCAFANNQATGILNIEGPRALMGNLISIEQFNTIPGLSVVSIDQDTPPSNLFGSTGGTAQVLYTITPAGSGLPDDIELQYRHQGDVAYGTAVPILTSGVPQPSPVTLVTDALEPAGYSIDVEFDLSATPKFGGPYGENLTIFALYGDAADGLANPASAKDDYHRGNTGSSTENLNNPHGLNLSDLAAFIQKVTGTLIVGNNIDGTLNGLVDEQKFRQAESPAILYKPSVVTSAVAARRNLLVMVPGNATAPGAAEWGFRVYYTGDAQVELVVNAIWDNTTGSYYREIAGANACAVRVSGFKVEFLAQIAGTPDTWTKDAWSVVTSQFNFVTLINSIRGVFDLGNAKIGTQGDAAIARVKTDYAGLNTRTRIWESARTGVANSDAYVLRAPAALSDGGSYVKGLATLVKEPVEVVLNATWNFGANQWTRTGSSSAAKLVFGAGPTGDTVFGINCKDGGPATWADSDWDRALYWEGSTGTLTVNQLATAVFAPTTTLSGGPPAANVIYTDSVVKAWGVITSDTNGTAWNLVGDGFNVGATFGNIANTRTPAFGNTHFVIPFDTPMSNKTYAVVCTAAFADTSDTTDNPNSFTCNVAQAHKELDKFEVSLSFQNDRLRSSIIALDKPSGPRIEEGPINGSVPTDFAFQFVVFANSHG